MKLQESFVNQCKHKLLQEKSNIINRVQSYRDNLFSFVEKSGDEADQTSALLQEKETLSLHERLKSQLMEIEKALTRIEKGSYGICEETEEPIEMRRLHAIPWTSLSIEGAEIRENVGKKYAK